MTIVPPKWPSSVAELVAEAKTGRVAALRSALDAVRALPVDDQGPSFKLGICRTFTIEPQLAAITLGLATIPSRPEIIVADLENIEQVILDPASPMLAAAPDAVLVLWRLEELHPRLAFSADSMSVSERERAADDVIARIRSLCDGYARVGTAPLFLSLLPDVYGWRSATRDVYLPHGPRHAILRINAALLDIAAHQSIVHLFDFAGWAAAEGDRAFDLKFDLYARQPVSGSGVWSFASAVADAFRPLLRPPAKVLVLDLDNVLWGGILGEDGIGGLKIGHDFPGNVFRRIQQYAMLLKSRGILLVLLSKNNETDVERAFATLRDMPLTLGDFVARRVNWDSKSENLKAIARELNLGLDSFVFVDDQPFEREQMRFAAPEVRILEAGEDPLVTLRALMECHWFDTYRVSSEDQARSADYAAQAQRRELAETGSTSADFLQSLGLQAEIAPVSESTIPRVVQMLGKTNQFNVTTRRHSEAEVRRMVGDPNNSLLVLSLRDRFGDQGIVGLAIMLGDPERRTATLDSFLFSCRAIGRGAEDALWAAVLSRSSAMGYSTFRAEYRRTPKNGQVADLFDRYGMSREPSSTSDTIAYRLDLPAEAPVPRWIDVLEPAAAEKGSIA